ncbi:toll/interleukin-1 receptor domain-containing protein [bacterium]|nr:toll/interleukin-1 receptor domain-containing protein [bacterium]
MSHVFVSYSHDDDEFVSEIEQLLEESGYDAWTDHDLLAGENWKRRIDEAIESAFALVVFMTPAAKASEFVTYEWSYALGVGVTVIPVLLRETELHPKLQDLQHLDFTEDITAPLKKLLARLADLEIAHHIKLLRHNPHYQQRSTAAARLGELPARDELSVVDRERMDIVVEPGAERGPRRPIPRGDEAGRCGTRGGEIAADDQVAAVPGQGAHAGVGAVVRETVPPAGPGGTGGKREGDKQDGKQAAGEAGRHGGAPPCGQCRNASTWLRRDSSDGVRGVPSPPSDTACRFPHPVLRCRPWSTPPDRAPHSPSRWRWPRD